MVNCCHLQAIACAERAATRAAAIAHRESERRVSSLRAIACIATLLGALGTAASLMRAFVVWDLPDSMRGEMAGGLGDAFIFVALSMPVAVVACGCFYYLDHRIKTFDFEMRVATLDIANALARLDSTNV